MNLPKEVAILILQILCKHLATQGELESLKERLEEIKAKFLHHADEINKVIQAFAIPISIDNFVNLCFLFNTEKTRHWATIICELLLQNKNIDTIILADTTHTCAIRGTVLYINKTLKPYIRSDIFSIRVLRNAVELIEILKNNQFEDSKRILKKLMAIVE